MLIPSSSVCANSKKYACVFCVVKFSVLVWTMGDRIQIILCQAFPTSRQYWVASCGVLSRYCNVHFVRSSLAGICQYYLVGACANPWKLLGDWAYFVVDEIMNVVKFSDISLCAYSEASIIQKRRLSLTTVGTAGHFVLSYFLPSLARDWIQAEMPVPKDKIFYINYPLPNPTTAGDCLQLGWTGV